VCKRGERPWVAVQTCARDVGLYAKNEPIETRKKKRNTLRNGMGRWQGGVHTGNVQHGPTKIAGPQSKNILPCLEKVGAQRSWGTWEGGGGGGGGCASFNKSLTKSWVMSQSRGEPGRGGGSDDCHATPRRGGKRQHPAE